MRTGRPYRYLYGKCVVSPRPCNSFDAICRVDVTDGSVRGSLCGTQKRGGTELLSYEGSLAQGASISHVMDVPSLLLQRILCKATPSTPSAAWT